MNSVSNYIDYCLAHERYAFSWQQVAYAVPKTEIALRSEILRLTQKKLLLGLRKDFYLILPPRYRAMELLPIELYADILFKELDKPYYLGLFTAAARHGAAHQQVQKSYVVTSGANIRDIAKGNIEISIFNNSVWPKQNIQLHKGDAGVFKVSSPALTAVDLVHYQNKLGGLNRIASTLEELVEAITPQDLKKLLTWYPRISTIQRLGYLMEQLEAETELIELLKNHLKQHTFYPILLKPSTKSKDYHTGNFWQIAPNVELELD